MTEQLTLPTCDRLQYPHAPGCKRPGTSAIAAEKISCRVEQIRADWLRLLTDHGPMTADEIGELLGLSPFENRPRGSELVKMRKIAKSGMRRANSFGNPMTVWTLAALR